MKTKEQWLKTLGKCTLKTYEYIHKLGGEKKIRNNLGVEALFRWSILYQLKKELEDIFLLSPEIKIGHPKPIGNFKPIGVKYKKQPSFDMGILEVETWNPLLISELKVTGYAHLKENVETDIIRLLDTLNYRENLNKKLPILFGLIYYIEDIKVHRKKVNLLSSKNEFLIKSLFTEYWENNASLLKKRYFEIFVREDMSNPPLPSNIITKMN